MRLSDRLREPVRPDCGPLPDLARVTEAVKRIRHRWQDLSGLPKGEDREKALQAFARRVERDSWEGCTVAEAARCLRLACLPDLRKQEYRRALRVLLDEILHNPRPSLVSAALSSYLETWTAGDLYTRALAQRLARLDHGALPARWRRLAGALPSLFDADSAHQALAERMAAADDAWAALRMLGVPDPHGGGLWEAAGTQWLGGIEPTLTSGEGVERVLRWLHPEGARSKLQKTRATRFIAALIGAWGRRAPPAEIVERITGRLTVLYGDPRLNMDSPWAALDRELLGIYRHWLTGVNLRLFLDVITEAEAQYTRPEYRHMWGPRHRFWLDLYERGRIREAWPAFSRWAAMIARNRLGARGLQLDHGTQRAPHWRRQHLSILLMRIACEGGDKIVVEGSHNYMVHVFSANDGNAPRLYQPSYNCEDIRLRPKLAEIVHRPDRWQGELLEALGA